MNELLCPIDPQIRHVYNISVISMVMRDLALDFVLCPQCDGQGSEWGLDAAELGVLPADHFSNFIYQSLIRVRKRTVPLLWIIILPHPFLVILCISESLVLCLEAGSDPSLSPESDDTQKHWRRRWWWWWEMRYNTF